MKNYTISVDGAVDSPFEITLAELAKLPQWHVEAVLQVRGISQFGSLPVTSLA